MCKSSVVNNPHVLGTIQREILLLLQEVDMKSYGETLEKPFRCSDLGCGSCAECVTADFELPCLFPWVCWTLGYHLPWATVSEKLKVYILTGSTCKQGKLSMKMLVCVGWRGKVSQSKKRVIMMLSPHHTETLKRLAVLLRATWFTFPNHRPYIQSVSWFWL